MGQLIVQDFVTADGYAADSNNEFWAPALNGLRRHVFSRQLKAAPWGDFPPSTVESGDAIQAIRRIKRESAKDIVLWGSLSLGRT